MYGFEESVCEHLGTPEEITPVSGGDIASAYSVKTPYGHFFIKVLKGQRGIDNLTAEMEGLRWLSKVEGVRTPRAPKLVTFDNGGFLAMDFIRQGQVKDEKELGEMLAFLHSATTEKHGWSSDNFIGRLDQSNMYSSSWPEFWSKERLHPQKSLAEGQGLIPLEISERIDKLRAQLSGLLPDAPPSRLHGDLWNGNVIFDKQGLPYFIDPAVYAGHSEVDLAMMQLFGGFGRDVFDSYEVNMGLSADWRKRTPVYQLYYALVHVNMFGRSYLSMVDRLLATSGF